MSLKQALHILMITLGCSKNTVDAECMTRILADDGNILTTNPLQADVIIVNTCGFIDQAKREAIDTILAMAEYKNAPGHCQFLVVTGCLPQRYSKDILKELPEVDAVVGTAHYGDIANVIRALYRGGGMNSESFVEGSGGISHLREDRIVSTSTYAWLKIAEGCSNCCSYCAIPLIRGGYVSRSMDSILREAEKLAEDGFSEIILTAQDTTRYGLDLYGKRRLPELIRRISLFEGVQRIRIMYTYSDGVTDELIREIADNPKVMHYLDMPVQHGDDAILKRMNRRDTAASISETIGRLRAAIPDIVLRSTVLVGFPGETASSFHNMFERLKEWRFDRLGCFVFSREEGTASYDMTGRVRKDTAERRYAKVMEFQQELSLELNRTRVGSIVDVTIESVSDDGIFYMGRSYAEAPEVDPQIFVAAADEPLTIGQTYRVKLVDCSAYELTGVIDT